MIQYTCKPCTTYMTQSPASVMELKSTPFFQTPSIALFQTTTNKITNATSATFMWECEGWNDYVGV